MAAIAFLDRARRWLERGLRKMRGIDERVVSLERPDRSPGPRALFSYILDPFLLPPGRPVPYSHTNFWESRAMAETLRELGFQVDVIHWTNRTFRPAVDYDLIVDVRLQLDRLSPVLGSRCLKVLHAETCHYRFHNRAQLERLQRLERRRGIRLAPYKLVEENRAIELADCATVLGNEHTRSTYAFAGKPLFSIPISQPFLYDFPESKEFDRVRHRFLWFGSSGLLHKGLDLVLEAFASAPDLELEVVGPVDRERDFARAFRNELRRTPNIRCHGWMDIADPAFQRVTRSVAALVFPSCSESHSGSSVTCMHAGLPVLVTRETGLDVDPGYGMLLEDPTPEGVLAACRRISSLPPETLRQMSRQAWTVARARYTRDRFRETYRAALLEILERFRPELADRLPR